MAWYRNNSGRLVDFFVRKGTGERDVVVFRAEPGEIIPGPASYVDPFRREGLTLIDDAEAAALLVPDLIDDAKVTKADERAIAEQMAGEAETSLPGTPSGMVTTATLQSNMTGGTKPAEEPAPAEPEGSQDAPSDTPPAAPGVDHNQEGVSDTSQAPQEPAPAKPPKGKAKK